MNTRLQVEHPVTEQVTGLDLVKLQIAIAAGHRLPFAWESWRRADTPWRCDCTRKIRITIFSLPGKNSVAHSPSGPGIRLDEGVYEGWTVPMEYDPLLGKLIAWGNSREETIARLRRALEEYTITGIRTNVGLFRRILSEPDFLSSEIHTKWLDELLRRPRVPEAKVPANSKKRQWPLRMWQPKQESTIGAQGEGEEFAVEIRRRQEQVDRSHEAEIQLSGLRVRNKRGGIAPRGRDVAGIDGRKSPGSGRSRSGTPYLFHSAQRKIV